MAYSMALTTADIEALQAAVETYLEAVGRAGDCERMAERIALKHSRGDRVVGFRRRGREVLFHDRRARGSNELAIYEVDVDGTLLCVGRVCRGVGVEAWLRENRFYLDWVAPEWE